MTVPGQFSPIEDVIREAEERAERDWQIEHEPCPHSTWIEITTLDSPRQLLLCAACGQRDERPF